MRALVVYPGPEFSVSDVADKVAKGLASNGVQTRSFNLHDLMAFYTNSYVRDSDEVLAKTGAEVEYTKAFDHAAAVQLCMDHLKAELWKIPYDVLVIVSGFFTDLEALDQIRTRGLKVVAVMTEQPYELTRELELASHVDVAALNDPTHIEQFADVAPVALYLPHSFDPAIHHANGRADLYDFTFVGTGYPSRCRYFEKVDFGAARVNLAGNWDALDDDSPLRRYKQAESWSCLPNVHTAELYRQSAMSANIYRIEHDAGGDADGWAMGPREVELAACGTFFARDPRGESDSLFAMLPTITDPSELSDVIAWSMSHPVERQASADAARAAVADRDCHSVAGELLRAIEI